MPMVGGCFTLAPVLLHTILVAACGAAVVQLPHQIASRMSGEWGAVVQVPCHPFVIGESIVFNDGVGRILSADVNLTSAADGATEYDASGLLSLMERGSSNGPHSYAVCGERSNIIPTDKRPGFAGQMRATQLMEYVGRLAKPGSTSAAAASCDTETQARVFIRAVGGVVEDSWSSRSEARQALQYVELEFVAVELTAACIESSNKDIEESRSPQGSVKGRSAKRRMRGHRMEESAHQGAADQRVREGSIIIGLTRRKPPERPFYERYRTSIVLGFTMFVFRVSQAYFSYRRKLNRAR